MKKRILLLIVVLMFVGNMVSCKNGNAKKGQVTTSKSSSTITQTQTEATISTDTVAQTTPVDTTLKVWSTRAPQTTKKYQFVYKSKKTIDVDKLPPLNTLGYEYGPDHSSYFYCKSEYKEYIKDNTNFESKLFVDKNYPDFVVSECKGGICINKYIGKSK